MNIIKLPTDKNLKYWRNNKVHCPSIEDYTKNVKLDIGNLRGIFDLYEHLRRDGVTDLDIHIEGFNYTRSGFKFNPSLFLTTHRLNGSLRRKLDGDYLMVSCFKNYLLVSSSENIKTQLVQAKTYGTTYKSIRDVFFNYQSLKRKDIGENI